MLPVRFLALLILWASAATALAHPIRQNAMWVLVAPDAIKVGVAVSLEELAVVEQVKAEATDANLPQYAAAAERFREYLLAHLVVKANGAPLPGGIFQVTSPPGVGAPDATFFVYELSYSLPAAPVLSEVTLEQTMLQEWPYAPGVAWDISYAVRLKSTGHDAITSLLLRPGAPLPLPLRDPDQPASSPGAEPGAWLTFAPYFHHGVLHILTGIDHLLFVAALVLGALRFMEMVKVVAAFTVAHTLTLILSVCGIFRLPSWFVEPTIAASILFVAIENVVVPSRAHSGRRLLVAFGFGLIHGLGFAGGLLDAMQGLPTLSLGVALTAFSLGVETGHMLVVALLFGALTLVRRLPRENTRGLVVRGASAVLVLGGIYFFVVSVR